jgi:hypothetical protein
MTDVVFTSKRESAYAKRDLPTRYEEVDLTETYVKYPDESVVCRTCIYEANRKWAYAPGEFIMELAKGTGDQNELICHTNKVSKTFRVMNTIDPKRQLAALTSVRPETTRALVDSCGHSLKPKCRSCDRFEPVRVAIPYGRYGAKVSWKVTNKNGEDVFEPYTDDGSDIAWWNKTIGGRCGIGPEGIRKGNEVVFCDPIVKKPRIESPSCANCFYLDQMGEKWQFDYLTVNANAALTPYERERALRSVGPDTTEAQAVGLALYRKQTNPLGRSVWHRASLLKSAYHQGEQKYRVRFDESKVTAVLAEGDPRWTVHGAPKSYVADHPGQAMSVAVEILHPHHELFRLRLPTRRYALNWPELPKKVRYEAKLEHRRDPNCPRCRYRTCYYHAKAPVKNILTGEVTFSDPDVHRVDWVTDPRATMKVVLRHGDIMAVDGNGNLPEAYSDEVANASVFRIYLPSLLAKARRLAGAAGVRAIQGQYSHVRNGLSRATKGYAMRPAWYNNTGAEPSKPTCSHPNGLNLRRVMNDSFGSERTDLNFDLGAMNQMEIDEEIRVGYRQHNLTPQRLQEEEMATILSHPRYDAALGEIPPVEVDWPQDMKVTVIEGIGGMTDANGNPVTTVAEFMEHLDTEDALIGMHGEAERFVSKRMQLYGYDLSRGFFGQRRGHEKTAMPAGDSEMVIFDMTEEPDQVDIEDGWKCVDCGNTYDTGEIADFFYPTCACGADLYRNHAARDTLYTRAAGGVGSAILKDTPAMAQRKRLYETVCPQWRLNSKANITLNDVWGIPEKSVEIRTERKTGPTIHRVPMLNAEHRKVNDEWQEKMDAVIVQRTSFREQHPEVSNAELLRKFPAPGGTVYQEVAQGSLSKAGSVAVIGG